MTPGNGKRQPYVGRRKGKGAKYCRECKRQGKIIDTRQAHRGHVLRRYRCKCGLRWTTVEHYLGDGKHNAEEAFMAAIKESLRGEVRTEIRQALGL
jgi:hypothetical protein